MERWVGKVAVVTGASSGIGATIVIDLVKAGMFVVGLARRKECVDALRSQIPSDAKGKLHSVRCDVSKDADVVKAFDWILDELGSIHVLVNNAGIMHVGSLTEEGNEEQLYNTLQTNLWGLVMCTKKAVEIMKRQKVVGAHIININSVLGHSVPNMTSDNKPIFNIYPSTKFGVTALSEILRQEFTVDKLNYKITSISPAATATEIVDPNLMASWSLQPILLPQDVSDAVLFALGTPPHVLVVELTVRAL